MATLPEWSRKKCPKCPADIAYVRTLRKSKGQPVDIPVDFLPDKGKGGTVPVEVRDKVLYGNPVPNSQADAMRAAGLGLHAQHASSCQKRGTSSRNT